MTYDEVCAEIVALGGTEVAPGVYVMPTPELHLLPEQDYTVRGVTYEGTVVAQAWAGSNYAGTMTMVGREQVAPMLPELSAIAVEFAGGTP